MENSKVIAIPLSTSCNLDKEENGGPIEQRKYLGKIGYLLYLIAFHLDIIFVVCQYARFQVSPKESHLSMVKHIMRYLTNIQQMGQWYPNGADCDLFGYIDSDFDGCILDIKSTSGTCHLLGKSLVSWQKKKQVFIINR